MTNVLLAQIIASSSKASRNGTNLLVDVDEEVVRELYRYGATIEKKAPWFERFLTGVVLGDVMFQCETDRPLELETAPQESEKNLKKKDILGDITEEIYNAPQDESQATAKKILKLLCKKYNFTI